MPVFFYLKITMPKISDTDLAEIFGDAEVTDSVTVAGGFVNGYFFAPYQGALEIAGSKPSFRCSPGDVVGVVVGDPLVHLGTKYTITGSQLDRAGAIVFVLKVAA